jgi:hypothetical protein
MSQTNILDMNHISGEGVKAGGRGKDVKLGIVLGVKVERVVDGWITDGIQMSACLCKGSDGALVEVKKERRH